MMWDGTNITCKILCHNIKELIETLVIILVISTTCTDSLYHWDITLSVKRFLLIPVDYWLAIILTQDHLNHFCCCISGEHLRISKFIFYCLENLVHSTYIANKSHQILVLFIRAVSHNLLYLLLCTSFYQVQLPALLLFAALVLAHLCPSCYGVMDTRTTVCILWHILCKNMPILKLLTLSIARSVAVDKRQLYVCFSGTCNTGDSVLLMG